MDEVAHIVHSVVVFFDGSVKARLFVPAVELELPDTVPAALAEENLPRFKPGGDVANTIQDRVRCFLRIEPAVPPDGLYEAGSRRVHDDRPD